MSLSSTNQETIQSPEINELICYHCGERCGNADIRIEEKLFCCQGCRIVYELITENGLSNYYRIASKPGIRRSDEESTTYAYLDNADIVSKLLDFQDAGTATITFSIPQIHCSACIWLLENLPKFNPALRSATVNFLKREVFFVFTPEEITLRQLVELLASLGYAPEINWQSTGTTKNSKPARKIWLKLGVAGFAFGNIMLLSFPEYLSGAGEIEPQFLSFFSWMNLVLSLPVLFYSAADYFKSAIVGLRQRMINMDVPIAIGMLVLLIRSYGEIISATGTGYLDSFTGLVFFLLLGKLFQQKTYDSLNFERDYRSYFPISTTTLRNGEEKSVPIARIEVGDHIIVRNRELIPADAVLISENTQIDYSFVTGESRLVNKSRSDLVFAGGRISGVAAEFEIRKQVSQSYLTQLWKNEAFLQKRQEGVSAISNTVSHYFTFIVLGIAIAAMLYWLPVDRATAWNAFTAVLIVACPCALALSIPFTFGNGLRYLARSALILKSTEVIEKLAGITTIIFDKTGTLTIQNSANFEFQSFGAQELTKSDLLAVKTLARQSTHPMSYRIYQNIDGEISDNIIDYVEIEGAGITGNIAGREYKIGSASWLGYQQDATHSGEQRGASALLAIDGEICGKFIFANTFRSGLATVLKILQQKYRIALLSGDSDYERNLLKEYFGAAGEMHFNQRPADKISKISAVQDRGEKVLMIGDGLNDAGALQQSDVGIAISDDITAFSPACDGILKGNRLQHLSTFLYFSRSCIKIVYYCFAMSFIYNVAGLCFAVQGLLSPLFAAVLMPLSSITVVLFATMATTFSAGKAGLIEWK